MPDFASALKEEITRLARKELRKELEGLKKSSAQYRSEIAALKRSVATLEKQLGRVSKKAGQSAGAETAPGTGKPVRFSVKGLISQRRRLSLSAAEFGAILGVSAQTIYNWEAGKTRPKQTQLEGIARAKKLGKRQANAILAERAG